MSGQSPAEAYGALCGALQAGMEQFIRDMARGFDAGYQRAQWAARSAVLQQVRQLDDERRATFERSRLRVAAFDVAEAQARLDRLGARIAGERRKHGWSA